ncbi:hypothetical protein SAMN05421636_10916 [Pricia antarctica]|uniref:Uncharacterized protein n=1 Tax=Pricia antarctica TaxID=641691 RepID=A0A1G7H5P2_9FLAO|nr:hypothetical protein [Pricia antarctica]SDE95748.1 hypothetical protein SAMN05421636_10916 [Pricia antarctica]
MKKQHWLWNILAVVTVILCSLVFVMHYKNWTSTDTIEMKILSGFYYKKLKYSELDSVKFVEKIPPMERLNGFSAQEKGKGIYREFKDSLTDKKVYVFVDNFSNQKIAVTYQDSLKLYFNFKDSIETQNTYQFLTDKIPKTSN